MASRNRSLETQDSAPQTRESPDAYGETLVRLHDLAGRPRGLGFVADRHGTVLTSHEAVDGLPRLVLRGAAGRECVVTADAVTPLPALDLALVRSESLGIGPLPITVRDRVETGGYVRIAAGCWREARVLGTTAVEYTTANGVHCVNSVLELAIGTAGRDALRPGGGAAGGPVLDAATGSVLAVLGTALRSGPRHVGFAVPLRPGAEPAARPDGGEALRTLADATSPALARRVAALVREAVERRPELAGQLAAYVEGRLEQGPAARALLYTLVTALLDTGPEGLRAALAGVLAGPGSPGSGPLRRTLRDGLLAREQDPVVLDALLRGAARNGGDELRDLVHRTGLLLVRTPHGATVFDRALVDLGRHLPGFAARVTGWLAETPQEWAALVGPSARRTLENLAGTRVPV